MVYFTALEDPEETNRLRGQLSEAREAIGTEEVLRAEQTVRERKENAG